MGTIRRHRLPNKMASRGRLEDARQCNCVLGDDAQRSFVADAEIRVGIALALGLHPKESAGLLLESPTFQQISHQVQFMLDFNAVFAALGEVTVHTPARG